MHTSPQKLRKGKRASSRRYRRRSRGGCELTASLDLKPRSSTARGQSCKRVRVVKEVADVGDISLSYLT